MPVLAEKGGRNGNQTWKILENTDMRAKKEKYIYILVDIFLPNLLYFPFGYGIITESGAKSQKCPQNGEFPEGGDDGADGQKQARH
ncbi:MAG: hypothetical protein IJ480_08985 [Clostridia bacterium]|nr:hypothetical protein [Clostridia bacterium]